LEPEFQPIYGEHRMGSYSWELALSDRIDMNDNGTREVLSRPERPEP
jgi:hypothetical protein